MSNYLSKIYYYRPIIYGDRTIWKLSYQNYVGGSRLELGYFKDFENIEDYILKVIFKGYDILNHIKTERKGEFKLMITGITFVDDEESEWLR